MTVVTTDLHLGVEALKRGGLVAFPTETVYGLGADASRADAVSAIFDAKGRPRGHPLIVHLASPDQVPAWARLDELQTKRVERLAEAFWPGPLSIVVPRSAAAADETVGGRPTIGLRIPDHPVALELLAAFGGGVAAPSANRFGRVSPTTAAHVLDDLDGLVDVVIDGGPSTVGIESTIVELIGPEPVLLRPGAVGIDDLERALGETLSDDQLGESRAPGMLTSHYAPDATIELATCSALDGTVARSIETDGEPTVVGVIAPFVVERQPSWHLPADAEGYAAEIYRAFREADRMGVGHLVVVPPSVGGMVDAVVDRLTKAAAPRR